MIRKPSQGGDFRVSFEIQGIRPARKQMPQDTPPERIRVNRALAKCCLDRELRSIDTDFEIFSA